MDQRKVAKTRELIGCGFYDDPEVLDGVLDRCAEAIMHSRRVSRAKRTRTRPLSELPAGRRDRVKVRLTRRRPCAATVGG
jgi:hypothetical protein